MTVVVSYRNSTSNHNAQNPGMVGIPLYLIEILHQTTTIQQQVKNEDELYLIEILHQTTTLSHTNPRSPSCILSKFYIKPQRRQRHYAWWIGCILSKFYIKPQLRLERELTRCVVSYRNSTSNHNSASAIELDTLVVSYRNSTSNHNYDKFVKNLSSVVSYRNSTSNHNLRPLLLLALLLYLIEILHQTTTINGRGLQQLRLYLIEILHQTTTSGLILIDKVLLTGCLPL